MPSSQKYARAQADGLVERVVEQRAELACGAVVGVAHFGFQRAHVGEDGLVGGVDGAVVILVAVSRIAEYGVGEFLQGDLLFDAFVRITVRTVAGRLQAHSLSGHQIMYHVPAAVVELSGMHHVQRIVFGGLGGTQVAVDRRNPAVGRHVVDPDFRRTDGGHGLPEIDERARGTHGSESPGGDHVHLPGRLHGAFVLYDVDDFLGGRHYHVAAFDFFVDFSYGFVDFEFRHIRCHSLFIEAVFFGPLEKAFVQE